MRYPGADSTRAASNGALDKARPLRSKDSKPSMIRAIFTLSAASLLLASAAPAKAPPFDTPAEVAYLIDLSSGAVLLSKNADQRMPPASMAKMMTTNVAFELIKRGDLKLDKMCTVRPETWKRWHGPAAGSTMFLSP